MTAPRLRLHNVAHSFFGVAVVKDVSFDVQPGEVLGLIGENGAGKSTLMNVVGGVLRPGAGDMAIDGAAYVPESPRDARARGVAHVHQELNLFSHLSIADNVFLTSFPRTGRTLIDKKATRAATADVLALLDLPFSPQTLVKRLSPGQRQMLEIAKSTVGAPGLLILDEPTTSLTSRETDKLFALIARLRTLGTSFIYVSHILGDVKEVSDRVAVMRDGALVSVAATKDLSIPQMISSMVGRPMDKRFPVRTGEPGSTPMLEVRNLTARGQVEDASLIVRSGEVVGVFGLMGAGRTELARLVYGLDKADSGNVLLDGTDITGMPPRQRIAAGLAFVTEDRRGEGLLMEESVRSNVALPSLARWAATLFAPVPRGKILTKVRETTNRLRLKANDLTTSPVRSLSGGNQQKVVLAKWLQTQPKLIILDEPTRGVDVGAQYEVYRTVMEVADHGAGVLLISSELPELLGIADRILVMRLGQIVDEFARADFEPRAILGRAFGEQAAQQARGVM